MERPVQSNEELPLAASFPAADEAAWRALVDKVLRGVDFERRLVHPTADGIPVGPLYTEAEAGALRRSVGLPGRPPFIRGAAPASSTGWDVRQRHAERDPAAANTQILEDLEGGATSIQLCL